MTGGGIYRVGPNRVKIRELPDGTKLVGVRKFTYQELIEYKRNMYGKNYFRRLGKTNAKRLAPLQRHDRIVLGWETKKDRYGDDAAKKIMARALAKRSQNADWRRHNAAHLQSPEMLAKRNAAIRAKKYFTTENHKNRHRYFVCDCEIDGWQFHEGEWLDVDDPLYEKARLMCLVDPKDYLAPETRHLAMLRASELNRNKMAMKYWLIKHPSVLFAIIDAEAA